MTTKQEEKPHSDSAHADSHTNTLPQEWVLSPSHPSPGSPAPQPLSACAARASAAVGALTQLSLQLARAHTPVARLAALFHARAHVDSAVANLQLSLMQLNDLEKAQFATSSEESESGSEGAKTTESSHARANNTPQTVTEPASPAVPASSSENSSSAQSSPSASPSSAPSSSFAPSPKFVPVSPARQQQLLRWVRACKMEVESALKVLIDPLPSSPLSLRLSNSFSLLLLLYLFGRSYSSTTVAFVGTMFLCSRDLCICSGSLVFSPLLKTTCGESVSLGTKLCWPTQTPWTPSPPPTQIIAQPKSKKRARQKKET